MTSVTIDLPNDRAGALKASAAAQGLTLESWLYKLVECEVSAVPFSLAREAAVRIREIQQRSNSDPERLTVHDYIDRGGR